jgi:hypothetical protein
MSRHENLFEYVRSSVTDVCGYLGLGTRIIASSGIAIDRALKAEEKVLALCKATGASAYVNAIGGQKLYSREEFEANGVELKFLESRAITYRQFGEPFVPWLSIVDVMMFNPVPTIREFIEDGYELV